MIAVIAVLGLTAVANAHVAAWAKGMYCLGGPSDNDDQNTKTAVDPLYMLDSSDWWFQHDRGCDKFPPKEGDILELPANGKFTVELAHNRAQTTLSYNGQFTTDWPDGKEHPEDWKGPGNPPDCIQDDGAMHTSNQSMAAGTAFAISYNTDLAQVTMENLVVFSVLEHTPWKRLATYEAPDLPACPTAGCTCAWLWVPKGCGQPNMYMQGFRCNVTGASSSKALAPAKAPIYCEGDSSKCVRGAKQMIAWNQKSGNNVEPPIGVTPTYSESWGWPNGRTSYIPMGELVADLPRNV
ncbi:lignocellulolytic auxiliary activity family 14 protein [Aspergillus alliaceus]|uniref:lignocellulolytic auxiliary activity family 14 protein n=1 Tax=Petromyces alliaceus TaxID=209559 RepID=UPI0012A63D3E|nr:uncharacterized protein BDW43DRAFT_321588 [Aspergillus alliaceus]KAB8230287.1 hypothetical protein BDW43DRAFT_321588 [Aspergillus alliaceus]